MYTLLHTPLQQSFLKQFCAAGMKRQTTPPQPQQKKNQSLLLSVIFLTVPWTLEQELVSRKPR